MTRTVWHWSLTNCLHCRNTIAVRGNPLSHGSSRFDATAPVYRRCAECAAAVWWSEQMAWSVAEKPRRVL